ncbi:hypothetical protein GJ496_009121 [Pomphorhynchus laevis]|nr:hypothetical protein GJ496_009121 [Pomphorhynchus laevis]
MLITGTTTRSALFGKRLMSYNSSTQSSSPMSVNSNKTDNSEETRKSTRPTKQRRSIIDAQLSSIESNEVKFEYDENNDEDYRPSTATPKPLLSIQLRQRAQQRTSPTIQNECLHNKEPYIDDDIIQPCNSIKRSKRKNHRVPQTDGSNLCLYRWPLQPDSPIYMLQDQLIQFLCFKSFKRKYNSGLQRRRVEPKERIYLKSKRKLRSDQVYMNSIALQVDEVIKLLNVDFPNHCRVLSERLEITLQANDQSNEHQTETDERSKSPLVPFKNRKNLANSLNVVASTSQLDILSDRFLAWPKLKKFKSFAVSGSL